MSIPSAAWYEIALVTIRKRRAKHPDGMIDYSEEQLADRCADAAVRAIAGKRSAIDVIHEVLKASGL